MLTKGITVIAPNPVQVLDHGQVGAVTQIAVPAGQKARIAGLHFVESCCPGFGGTSSHKVVASGDVTFEDCQLNHGWSPALQLQSGTFVLNRCNVLSPALCGTVSINNAVVSLVSCFINGHNGFSDSVQQFLSCGTGAGGQR